MPVEWKDVSKWLSDTTQKAVRESKELAHKGRVQYDILSLRHQMAEALAELGSIVYDMLQKEKTPAGAGDTRVKELVEKVHDLELQLKRKEKEKKTKAQLNAWVREGVKIEEDAVATISTLGFMGEKYMEISPGTPGKKFLKNGDLLVGKDPVSMAKVFENLSGLTDSVKVIVDRLKNGEGTIGKLLTRDKIHQDLEAFVEDIKNNPWKLLNKPRGQ